MTAQPPSNRSRVRRVPGRGKYDRATILAILREGLVCNAAISDGGEPFALPMVYGVDEDALYLHGSNASRLLRAMTGGAAVCVTVTLLDGLVLARSAYHHSMNYRSVMVLGKTTELVGEEKLRALNVIVEHVAQGRWEEARRPNEAELRATAVVRLPLDEASAKVRTGPPVDEDEDLALPIWAGLIPLGLAIGAPEPAIELEPEVGIPPSVRGWSRTAPR